MTFREERQRMDSRDQVVIERESLDLVRDGLGGHGCQLVEGNVHCVNVELILLVKVVANLLNLILVNVQPVQGPRNSPRLM